MIKTAKYFKSGIASTQPGFKMKDENFAQTYFSTSQTAKILGLSVGTVQRMVESGVFKAFVTQGGHRRILSSSLNQFCQAQGFTSPQAEQDTPLICILHASDKINSTVTQLSHWSNVKVITQPLDLMGLHHTIGALFIDARMTWIHVSPMHLQDTAARDAHIVIYNSAQLPPTSALQAANRISLFDGDISTDLVFGYLLGNSRGQTHPGLGIAQSRAASPQALTGDATQDAEPTLGGPGSALEKGAGS